MKTAFRRTTTAFAAVATAGVSGLFVGAAPASAVAYDYTCAAPGTLVAPGVCELVFTDDGTFTRTAEMTKLEVLLVGAGGNATHGQRTTGEAATNGYAAGGGGGEVRVVDFSAATGEVVVTVANAAAAPNPSTPTTIVAGALVESADSGQTISGAEAGDSGNGNQGAAFTTPSQAAFGGGGGAGGDAAGANGGAGVVVNALVGPGSLFASDSSCYGGGGAVGFVTSVGEPNAAQGLATCGGGYPADASATTVVAPLANSGGGGTAVNAAMIDAQRLGADGFVAVRWPATAALAATGSETNVAAMSVAMAALVAGIGLAMAAAYTRRRRTSN